MAARRGGVVRIGTIPHPVECVIRLLSRMFKRERGMMERRCNEQFDGHWKILFGSIISQGIYPISKSLKRMILLFSFFFFYIALVVLNFVRNVFCTQFEHEREMSKVKSSLSLFLLNNKIRNLINAPYFNYYYYYYYTGREFNFVKIRDQNQVGETRFHNHRINNKGIS